MSLADGQPVRPTERDLALDAIDESFKSAMTRFTDNIAAGEWNEAQVLASINLILKARRMMLGIVAEWGKAK